MHAMDSGGHQLQRNCLKTIYGFQTSYSDAIEMSGIERLDVSRSNSFDKFAMKLADSKIYQNWLPKQSFSGYDLRKELFFKEPPNV